MVEFATKPDAAPQLQQVEQPVSLDTGAFTGSSSADLVSARLLETELISRHNLSTESSSQLSDIVSVLPPDAQNDLREALAHNALSPVERAELIESLHAILTTERNPDLASSSQRQELATSLLRTLADPLSAHQSDRRTCSVVSSVQTRMALTDPAEYARLIEGLTSKEGSVVLASGETMRYVENSAQADVPLTGDKVISRTLESRILQSACMQFAAGYEQNGHGEYVLQYDVARDVFHDTVHGNDTSGVYGNWQQKLTNNVFNEGSTRLDTSNVSGVSIPPRDVIDAIEESIQSNGTPVAVEVNWANQGDHAEHIMLVTKIEDGRVYFFNGWRSFHERDGSSSHSHTMTEDGKLESMSVEDFEKRIRSAYISDPSKSAAESALTELQAERQYNPVNPESYDIHMDPPVETYRPLETEERSSRKYIPEDEQLELSSRYREAAALEGINQTNYGPNGAAQQRNTNSNSTSKDDLFP